MSKELERYVNVRIAAGEAREQDKIKESNNFMTEVYDIYTLLKNENRLDEFKDLLLHENPYVRLSAAIRCLQFDDTVDESVEILEKFAKSDKTLGHEAHMTLFAWRNGMIKF